LHVVFEDAFFVFQAVVAVGAKVEVFSPDREKSGFETLSFQQHQRVLQNVFGGLLPWTPAYPNNYHNHQKPIPHLCTLNFPRLEKVYPLNAGVLNTVNNLLNFLWKKHPSKHGVG
jgi:hypothetical protein